MISSPYAKCHRKNKPKDECLKNCDKLNALQNYQVSQIKSYNTPAVDFTEAGRFIVCSRGLKFQMVD